MTDKYLTMGELDYMIFTNKEIVQVAMRQSAIDANCNVEDFSKKENVVVASATNEHARKYLK